MALTGGELDVMRRHFDGRRWPKAEVVFTDAGRRMIAKKLEELAPKTRWPGTKLFSHEIAYDVEMLERILARVDTALAEE